MWNVKLEAISRINHGFLLYLLEILRNRGRRVSFGVIHSIPSQGEASGRSTPGLSSLSPLLMSISSNNFPPTTTEPSENDQNGVNEIEKKKGKDEKTNAMVENIVDEMLQKAIDEVVLVTE